jgi:hypothetical protein
MPCRLFNLVDPLGPPLMANSLCQGEEERTIRTTAVQIKNSGSTKEGRS